MSKKKKHKINDEVKTKEELKIFCDHAYEKCCDEQGDINFYSAGNNCSNYNIVDKLFTCAYASVANVVIFQMQDVLKVGNIGRMNLPSSMGTNWRWRMTKNQFGDKEVERLRYLTDIYGR